MSIKWKTLITVVQSAVAFVVFIAFILFVPSLYNTYLVARTAESIQNIPLPDHTTITTVTKRFGLLFGNSNHCDLEINILIESNLPAKDFVDFLEDKIISESILYSFEKNQANKSLDVFLIKEGNIYLVYNQEQYKFITDAKSKNDCQFEGSGPNVDFGLDKSSCDSLNNLSEKMIDPTRYGYILRFTDQTFTGLRTYDFRCS